MVTRDELANNYTARPIVKFFLLFQDNPRALIFFISLIVACVIVTVLLYIINLTYIMISVIRNSADWKLIVNTLIATAIVITNFIVVKLFKFDDYIRGGILDTLFIARSEDIKQKKIAEVAQSPVLHTKKQPAKPLCTMIVLGKSVVEASSVRNDCEAIIENRVSNFTLAMVTIPFFLVKNQKFVEEKLKSLEEKPKAQEERLHIDIKPSDTKDAVYVVYGKYNTIDSKLYRFSVSESSSNALFNYLMKVTMFTPGQEGSPILLWKDNNQLGIQEQQIEKSIVTSIDSGQGSISDEVKLFSSEYTLSLDAKNVWQCVKKEDQQDPQVYIYFMTKKFSSLKEAADQANADLANMHIHRKTNIQRLLSVAKYIQKLHAKNIVHGNITMRNIQLIPAVKGFSIKEDVFISTECFFYLPEQLDANTQDGRKRRKFFDAEQRDDPTNMDKSTDVFAFGLCIIELLCKLNADQQKLITKAIRSHEVATVLGNAPWIPELVLEGFGRLFPRIFSPRAERATIDEVVDYLEKMPLFE